MEIRNSVHPDDFKRYTTEKIKREFLIQNMFVPGEIKLVYTHFDRMIVGGVCPNKLMALKGNKELGTDFFLARRELGVINVGSRGSVSVDGKDFTLNTKDGLNVGMGSKKVVFSSDDGSNPAHFYILSAPAHQTYQTQKIEISNVEPNPLGTPGESNVRTIYKYIHPEGVKSCQLCMGMTILEPNSIWNSMPCHTHARRMEVYFYFNLPADAVVFHLMGEPSETRHIVIRNEEAVISPDWSIHAGAGTSNYTFIWGMIGENQTFTDMDAVDMGELQ